MLGLMHALHLLEDVRNSPLVYWAQTGEDVSGHTVGLANGQL